MSCKFGSWGSWLPGALFLIALRVQHFLAWVGGISLEFGDILTKESLGFGV